MLATKQMMNKTIDPILSPKPELRSRIDAHPIVDKAHAGPRANGASYDSPGQRPGFPVHPPIQALKGRPIRCADCPALTGLAWVFTTRPRALPWAGMKRPVGAGEIRANQFHVSNMKDQADA